MNKILSVTLLGLLAFGCKTANFKGDTATKGIDPKANTTPTSVLENPIIPSGGTTNSETKPDGTVVTTTKLPDGTTGVVIKSPDGTTSTTVTKPSGEVTTVVNNPDGTGTKEVKNPDGTKTTTTVIVRPDGGKTTETKYPDNSTTKEEQKPDGTTVVTTTKPDGTVTTDTKKPDGTTTSETRAPDGKTTTTDTSTKPDGTVVTDTKSSDGTKTTTTIIRRPDGTSTTDTKTTTPGGKTTTETKTTKPDGTVTTVVTTPDGKTTTTVTKPNPDGTTTTTVTTPDGKITTNTSTTPVNPGKGDKGNVDPGKGGKPTTPIFVECPENPDYMLLAGLYEIPANSDRVPNFSAIQKKKDICLRQLDVYDREFTEGFPGIPGLVEWFALDIKWRVFIPEDGVYTFYINSDDGSYLYIDNTLVINNDGLHPHEEKQQLTKINKGWHNFRVTWYQGPRYRIALELFWKRPNASKRELIPVNYFARPAR